MVRQLILALPIFCLVTYWLPAAAHGQLLIENARLNADENLYGDIDRHEDRVAVSRSGTSVWIFERGAGAWQAVGKARTQSTNVHFGRSIALHDDYLVAGAVGHNTSGILTGAVWVYRPNGSQFNWQASQFIRASDEAAQEQFGDNVALSSDTLAVSSRSGVYLFELDANGDWQESQKIPLGDGQYIDAMDMDGDRIVASSQGAFYVIDRVDGSWTHTATVSSNGDRFRWAIAVSGDRVAVDSRRLDTSPFTESVHIYHFDSGSWALQQVLDDPQPGTRSFGNALSLDGPRLVVGSEYADRVDEDSGSAYFYQLSPSGVWQLEAELSGSDLTDRDLFGRGVHVQGTEAIVSALRPETFVFNLLDSALELILEGPQCTDVDHASLDVSALGTQPIDVINLSQNQGPFEPVCLDCGPDPSLTIDRPLQACDNQFQAGVWDRLGNTRTAELTVTYDDQPPTLNCQDRLIEIPQGQSGIYRYMLSFPSAIDNCDGLRGTDCAPYFDRFPVGTTRVTCQAADSCSNSVGCEYDLTISYPPEGCYLSDFVRELGNSSPGPGWLQSAIGNGSGFPARRTEDGLLINAFGQNTDTRDSGYFVYRPESGSDNLRVEIDVPRLEHQGPSAGGQAGLTLRHHLDGRSPKVSAMVDLATSEIRFEARLSYGAAVVQVAQPISRLGVRALAIEKTLNVYSFFYSLNGTDWLPLSGSVTLPDNDQLLSGLAVASEDPELPTNFSFWRYRSCAETPAGSIIRGTIWWDQDADARVDDAELPLEQVQVELRDALLNRLETTYTDSQGSYSFDDLAAGEYVVAVDSPIRIGGVPEPTFDADGTDTAEYARVTVQGTDIVDADFGYRVTGDLGEPVCQNDEFDDDVVDPDWFLTLFGDADQFAVSESEGTLKLAGDGTSMYLGPDNGAYLFRDFKGDFRVEVDVDGENMFGGLYAKAGISVRPGLGSHEPRLITQLIPRWAQQDYAVLQFRYRATEGGQSDGAWGSNRRFTPRQARLAIERQGNLFYTEFSFNGGQTWQRPAGGSGGVISLDWPDVVLVGLNVVSYDAAATSEMVFDNFSVCPLP